MNRRCTETIRRRIEKAPDGSVFVSSDFADLAEPNTVRQILNRLGREGLLRRVLRGVWDKPPYSRLLEEAVAPDPDAVAQALARRHHWTIAPGGEAVLNQLGLSTQVPAVWSYVSDGPYRTYRWGKTTLEFKHRANREITGLSPKTILVIQALKALGQPHITPRVLRTLQARLSKEEKTVLLRESAEATAWVARAIRQMAGEETEEARIRRLMARTGVYQYGLISTAQIPFYAEIRKICQENRCRSYGATWACPPGAGTFEECRNRCLEFDQAIVFSGKYRLQDSMDYEGMKQGHRQFKDLCDHVYQVLRDAYPRHLLLSNEGCIRCQRCTYPEQPCRMPERLFPALEGYGIQVMELAKAAGLRYYEGSLWILYFGMFLL